MTKYTIESCYYGNQYVQVFDDRVEWMAAINAATNQENTRGRGEGVTVSIYEAPDGTEGIAYNRAWNGNEYRGRRTYVDTFSIPEDWALESRQEIPFWLVTEQDGKWYGEDGTEYDTEQEAIECESPAQYFI